MLAKLISGEVVPLLQDCDCTTHSGPHWLHLDDIWKQQNTELLECGNIWGHVVESERRLEVKLQEMESRGIDEIYR